jgi:electron transport complex protein RnfD
MAENTVIVSPFLRRGPTTGGMMGWMLACLSVTALHFALRYDPSYAWRYAACLVLAGAVELLYALLKDGRLRMPHGSTLVTAALLTMSVPAHMPLVEVGAGILVAVLFGKLMVDRQALRLNPMLLGRLFMMLAFPDSIQRWLRPGVEIDAFSSATPLGLLAAEKQAWSVAEILVGRIRGDWEGVYAMLPGSPGETMPLLALACGLLLWWRGVLDWRSGLAYLAGFAAACAALGMPVLFHVAAGSTVFTAVYIVTDPRSMPGSKSGRLAAGLLAGILNAAIRRHGYYPEGVVLAVLAVNLLSPALDRLAFHLRGALLARQGRRHRQPQ